MVNCVRRLYASMQRSYSMCHGVESVSSRVNSAGLIELTRRQCGKFKRCFDNSDRCTARHGTVRRFVHLCCSLRRHVCSVYLVRRRVRLYTRRRYKVALIMSMNLEIKKKDIHARLPSVGFRS